MKTRAGFPPLSPLEWIAAAAAAAALLCWFVFPITNPDVFWHLSSARRMIELGGLPGEDWLSATRAGQPWINSQWGAHLLAWLLHALGGMAALWLFKIFLLAAISRLVWKILVLYDAAAIYRAAALALLAASGMTWAGMRPEQYSVLCFAVLLYWLEHRRLKSGALSPWWMIPLFAVWVNLHPGFPYGIILLGLYAAAEIVEQRKPLKDSLVPHLLAALAATMLQPCGPKLYQVLLSHASDMDVISQHIKEWAGIRLDNPWHWPYWALLLAGFAAALAEVRRQHGIALAPLGALLYYAFSAARHARMSSFFGVLAAPLAVHWALESGLLPREPGGRQRRLMTLLAVSSAAFCLAVGLRLGCFRTTFNDLFLPTQAVEYLEREKPRLAGKKLFNPWHWGGYIGWKLYPDFKVFQDGRYIFHPLLAEAQEGMESPQTWAAFLDRHQIEVVLLEDRPILIQGEPYFHVYMPPSRWDLLHRDGKALIFTRKR